MYDWLNALPKAELHMHLEGRWNPSCCSAWRNATAWRCPGPTSNRCARPMTTTICRNSWTSTIAAPTLLRTEQDFYDLTWAYLLKCQEQNVVHTEPFFDPQTHTDRGVPFETVLNGISQALEDGRKQLGVSSGLILSFLRHLPEEAAMRTLEQACPTATPSSRLAWTAARRAFRHGVPARVRPCPRRRPAGRGPRRRGRSARVHLGSAGPAQVRRIDHGVRAAEDPRLIARLIDEQIPLTVCPLSNTRLRVFQHMRDHNILSLLDAGVKVTVNSDDPAYFGGYVNENFHALYEHLGMSREQAQALADNSMAAKI